MSYFLHNLIHSLSQNEKRYFKLQADFMFSGHEKSYLKLFELISKEKTWNEKKLKQIMGEKYFSQQKQHLSKKILESLRDFHNGSNPKSLINNYLSDYQILLNKKLFTKAYKIIKKAEKLALTNELYIELISIKNAETALLVLTGEKQKLEQHITNMRDHIPKWVQLVDNTLQIEKEFILFVKLNRDVEFIRSESEQKILDTIMKNPVMQSQNVFTIRGKIYQYYIKGLYHFLSGQFNESLKAFEMQLSLFETNPNLSFDLTNEKAKTIANICLLYNKTKNKEGFENAISKLQNVTTSTRLEKDQIKYWTYLLRLNYFTSSLQIEKASEWIKKEETSIILLKEDFDFWNMMVTEMNYVMFDSVFVYLCESRYSEANKMINNYLNKTETDIKTDNYSFARILHLFIQLELGNDDYVSDSIISLTRYLKEQNKWFEFEKACIKTLKGLVGIKNKKDALSLLTNFHEQLLCLKKIRHEANAMISFNIIYWTELKLGKIV